MKKLILVCDALISVAIFVAGAAYEYLYDRWGRDDLDDDGSPWPPGTSTKNSKG